jgi:hypothetical protein
MRCSEPGESVAAAIVASRAPGRWVVMRLRSFAHVGGLLVLLLIIAGVTLSIFRVRPMGASIGVHSYQRQGDELSACLVLTNTGAVSLAVLLRFGCQVDRVSGFTNYLMDTRYTVFLQPREDVILSNALWRVRLPADTRAWKVKVQIRQPSGRERFVNALHRSGFLNHRILSRLAGRPRKEADYQWLECGTSWLEVPRPPSAGSTIEQDEWNGA